MPKVERNLAIEAEVSFGEGVGRRGRRGGGGGGYCVLGFGGLGVWGLGFRVLGV